MSIPAHKPKIRIHRGPDYQFVQDIVSDNNLNTVCEEARCPNIYECWNRRTATIMILGDTCTRACGFCSVKTGKPGAIDSMEPVRTAMAVKKMNLRHVVITSVDRDDIKNDYGSAIWAETIRQVHHHAPDCTVEVLTPDFKGYKPALDNVFNAKPDIFSHNIETIERISKAVRSQADWGRSLDVLRYSRDQNQRTKTGMMVGLGETNEEILQTMKQVADLGVKIFTIGQYLQPTNWNLPVKRYVSDEEFIMYREEGVKMGFTVVESGALVRSSYHADEQARLAMES